MIVLRKNSIMTNYKVIDRDSPYTFSASTVIEVDSKEENIKSNLSKQINLSLEKVIEKAKFRKYFIDAEIEVSSIYKDMVEDVLQNTEIPINNYIINEF